MRKDIIISERLHCGVSDEIFSQICKGNYRTGSILPSIMRLSREFGTSPETIRKALNILVKNNVLIKSKNAFFITNDLQIIEKYKEIYIRKYKNRYLNAMEKLGIVVGE
ncbi:MAG: GntR family transcriptional regulator [Anaerobutyricum hallii]|uniref:GntR family transcriptional regulator n=1 Tax=Blautia TaxID=572511 RepID=UPI001D0BB1BD|nr:GntR family transcriptional regulator [Blautia sp. DFI.1.216]MBS4886028.1 GntR family transcriptional regulator [Clostridiales bacterium]MCB8723933.1 GntR family transcriptional regulator [Blautia sp. DFI.1.216]